ncbi:dihydrofolate reductase family protein [Bacillus horti]|uniref:Dihydrofolate reductase n=1 Tax=Caldalkalibacillus horti TaxID=77523 RepID=A0ABT9W5L9_9BACI|nr:dihydrofolate reductase family protein [Bacillus horti]MDQ0168549.1 dihydrofolate reductase [Bacillus horti]
MNKVIADMSISLDGFIAGINDGPTQPLGEGGEHLHKWLFEGEYSSKYNDFFKLTKTSRDVFDQSIEEEGAILVGRRTYDIVGGWEGSHPAGVPVFVLTHEEPKNVPKGDTPFTFVTDGIRSAVEQAKAVAGKKHVGVAGASTIQQCLGAGLLDELLLHQVPVLLGKGIPLFEPTEGRAIELENTKVIEAPGVTHLGFRIMK